MLRRTLVSFAFFLSIFLSIALYSFHPLDPGAQVSSSYNLNQAGYVGAVVADFLFLHLGIGAYLLPVFSLMICVQAYRRKSLLIFSSFVSLFIVCFYLECYFSSGLGSLDISFLPSTIGGWLGQELKLFLFFWLGSLGSQVFAHLLFLQSLDSILGGTLLKLMEFCLDLLSSISMKKTDTTGQKKEIKKKNMGPNFAKRNEDNRDIAIQENWKKQAEMLSEQLDKYGIANKVTAIVPGPVVIRFELQLASGERSSKVVTLAKDLARSLLISHLNVIENIPGSSCIGIEIPQSKREVITLEPLLKQVDKSLKLPLVLGVQTQSEPVIVDLVKLPHLLVAGSTGSGKSVGVASMLLTLIKQHSEKSLRLILIDPKVLEFARYENIAHLALPVINDHEKALAALLWSVDLMEARYRLMAKYKVRNINDYHQVAQKNRQLPAMPYMVIVIDELADLMMLSKKAVEEPIARLAQKARACGIHLIVATQRPSVDIITGLIKANVPARLSYAVSSKIDSRTILDKSGGESLLGMGDAYFVMPGYPSLQRIHGAYVTDQEIDEVIEAYKVDKPDYLTDIKSIMELLGQES